jgi:outer membrane protein TolC
MNNKKIILSFLILCFACNTLPTMAFGLQATKSEKIMNETLGNSIVKEEYPSGSEVLPVETEQNKNEKAFLIEGSVEKSLDVNLNDCLKLALGNNPQIKVALNNALAAHSRIAQTWSTYFPELQLQSGYSKNRNLQTASMTGATPKDFDYYLLGQLSLSQMLYDFGVTQNQVTLKKLDYELYKSSITAVVNNVICQTKETYYNLLYAYEVRKVAKDTVSKYELFYNQAKAFYEIGLNPKVDVTIAEVNLSDAKLKLIQAENSIDIAMAKLNNAMGVPYLNKYNVEERLKFNPINITLNDTFELAKQSRPELKQAELKIEEADQTVRLAKKANFPKLQAQGSYARGGQSFNDTYGFNYGVYLNFPTVNGMLTKNQIKETRSLYDSQVASAQNTKNNVYLEIQSAYLTLYEKKNQMPVALLQVKQAKENYELSAGRYKVGVGNPTELKDAQNTYQSAQLGYYKALFDYNTAKAQLEKAIGKNIIGDDDDHIDFEA